MRLTLIAAAVYNLAWGFWVILRPDDLFVWSGIQPPRYPGIWQCVGMIVGVYGIGYALAATDPIRHWPITLVGFLGKILGPIGFFVPLFFGPVDDPGRLPMSWGLTIITNDLIWWIPFAAILFAAFKEFNKPPETEKLTIPQADRLFQSQHGRSIHELSQGRRVLLVFLRHSGCTFCRQTLADLSANLEKVKAGGLIPVIVHMGDNETEAEFFAHYGLADEHRISDPTCRLYAAYTLPRGRLSDLFGWSVWARGFRAAIIQRHWIGKLGGDGFQLGGSFIVRDDRVLASFSQRSAADQPDFCQLAENDAPLATADQIASGGAISGV